MASCNSLPLIASGWCLLFLANLYLSRDRKHHTLRRTKTGEELSWGLWGATILNKFWMWETCNVFVVTIVPPMTGDIFRNNLVTNIIICLRFVLDNTKDTIIIDVCYLFFHISSKIFLSFFLLSTQRHQNFDQILLCIENLKFPCSPPLPSTWNIYLFRFVETFHSVFHWLWCGE